MTQTTTQPYCDDITHYRTITLKEFPGFYRNVRVNSQIQRTNADIVRVVLAGNSLNETTRDKEETAKAKYLTKVSHILQTLYM